LKALVVSGGGSKGAFAVGAVRYMRETLGIEFSMVAGTSTGALIVPFVVSGDLALTEKMYTSVTNADILAPVSLQTTWKRGYLFDTAPLEKLLGRHLTEARARRILDSDVPAFLAAVSLQTGRLTYFQTGTATGCANGHAEVVKVTDRDMLISAIVASTNQPVFMPPVWLPQDQQPVCEYVDGGVREYAPIHVAIANGATEIYAVLHSPPAAARAGITGQVKGLPAMAARAIELLIDEVGDNDLQTAQLFSDATTYLETIRRNARGLGLGHDQITQLFAGANPFVGRRAVTLHVIRPEQDLGCSGLEFDPSVMKSLVALGARRAEELLG
jgi:NTE family protein